MATEVSQDYSFLDPNRKLFIYLNRNDNSFFSNGVVPRVNLDTFEGYVPLWCINFPKDFINPSNYFYGNTTSFNNWGSKNKITRYLGTKMNHDFSINRLFFKFLHNSGYNRGVKKSSLNRKLKGFKEIFVEDLLLQPIKINSKFVYQTSYNHSSFALGYKDVLEMGSIGMEHGSAFTGKHSYFMQSPFKALSMLCVKREYIPYLWACILLKKNVDWSFFKYFESESLFNFLVGRRKTEHEEYKQALVTRGIEIIKVSSFKSFFQGVEKPKLSSKEDIANWESYIKEILIDGKSDRTIIALDPVEIKVSKEEVQPVFKLVEGLPF